MEVKMIDVSVHNGVIDWDKVKASGIGGVLMRCGYGSAIESQDDKMFKRNADECSRLGIPFGVYLYSYAKNTDMAKSASKAGAEPCITLLGKTADSRVSP